MRYRRLGGGYRKEDVEFALAELRLTLRQLDLDLETLRGRAGGLEEELRAARAEVESHRAKDAEFSQTMASALHRANEIEEGAHERARAIIAAAEDAVQRSRSEASRRIEETGGQFNELIRLKENLVVALRGVVGEFEEALSRVERGESLYGRSAPFASAPPPRPPPVVADERLAPPMPFLQEPYVPSATIPPVVPPTIPPATPAPPPPPPRFAQPPVAPPPATEQHAPSAPPPPPPPPYAPPSAPVPPESFAPPAAEPVAQEEPLFETQVELDAGPFPDFASLSTFERSLARLPRVEDVYVRRLADDRVVIELTLSEPTQLVATMRETLPYDIQVQSASRSKLVINVLAHSTAAR